MGKTLNRDQRKHNKFMSRDAARQRKEDEFFGTQEVKPKKPVVRKKWRPHSEIDAD